MLVGRRAERAAIDRMLDEARGGRSGVLMVRGEAGIGKTALLEYARDAASGFRVERAVGVESEAEFAFAGLHQLCASLLDRLGALPQPQQDALGVALGQRAGDPPDGFLVGLATLSLLAEAAEERPLLCLVDDAQWLDAASAQTLAFVARRLGAERVALVFALRDPNEVSVIGGLPELRLAGLDEMDARELLAAAVRAPLDDGVRDRILAEARGNPLALVELPRGPGPPGSAALAGGFGLPDALGVPDRIEDSFRRRADSLPAQTRMLLLVAAAEPVGDTTLLWRAAARVGIGAEAAEPAEAAGLLELGTRVRFVHPLVRSAVYRAAAPPDRRRAHKALAAVTDKETDPDRRVWHRAQSVLGADESVAAELERAAGRVRARGGLAAAAAFLDRATALTPDPADRARRALAAAHAQHEAGSPDAARQLLTVAAAGPSDALHRARVELLHAQIAFVLTRGRDVPGMLLDAAKMLTPLDAALAREAYLQAMEAALLAGPLGPGRGVPEVAEAARDAPAPSTPPRPVDLLLDGLVTRYSLRYEASVPGLRRALEAFGGHDPDLRAMGEDGSDGRYLLWLASRVAVALWDDEEVYALACRHVRLAREAGALAMMPIALDYFAAVLVHTGELARAAELIDEAAAINQATGGSMRSAAWLFLAAWQGRQAELSEQAAATVQDATRRGEGAVVTATQYALTVVHNGLGDYNAALTAAAGPVAADELEHSNLALPEMVEAAVRAGEPARAAAALEQLSSRAHASGTQWALGVEARSRALTSTGPVAEELYREAIQLLTECRMKPDLARAHLVYGEWLRREGRRRDAREQLHTAHEQLSRMGMEAFAARAARELRATGERPRRRSVEPANPLTPHEQHIARLVATGATSKEIGAQLFLSPRTIDAHVRNVVRKLGITSRRQLRNLFPP
jgi:DNA-binding CsgD family transcriptional regulator